MNAVRVFLVCALASGCAAMKTKTPDWVSDTSRAYPASQYLQGRGEADTVEQAQDRARADLAKIFEVTVSAEFEDVTTLRRGSNTGAGGQVEQQSQARVQTRTEKIISGVRIAELWRDPKTKTHHALAVLSRAQAATSLREEIGKLDEATNRYLAQARGASDAFVAIGATQQALAVQAERESLQKTLKVVDPTGRGAESKTGSARLRADLNELLKRVRLAVEATAEYPDPFGRVVRGAVAHAGFLIETGERPTYVLEARLEEEDLGQRDGWYWRRGTLTVSLRDTAANRVRGSHRWALKASATDRGVARQRLMTEVDSALKKDLRATVIGFAGS
jgi:hypothetical protein